MKRIVCIAVLCSALAAPMTAKAIQFTVVSQGALSDQQVTQIERAVSFQVDHQVARYWPGAVASFGPGGMPITIAEQSTVPGLCGFSPPSDVVGCHYYKGGAIYVSEQSFQGTAIIFDHEVIEETVDPYGYAPEVCDPVAEWSYMGVGHVLLSDFTTPAYFQSPRRGRLDWMRVLAAKLG